MAQNISTLTQAYIDDVYARIQTGNLTPEESALLVAGMQSLQQNTDLTAIILGIAQSSNTNITASIDNLITRLETLESQMSSSLQSHLPPIVPINGTHSIQYFPVRGSYGNYNTGYNVGPNYCINYVDEILNKMYILSTQRADTNLIDMEFGFYDEDGNYNLLKSGQFENFYSGINFELAGAFILPIRSSNINAEVKVCIIFYNTDSVWLLDETSLSPGSLIRLQANEPRTWLCYDRINEMLVFMPNTTSAVRLYANGTTDLVTDHVVNDSNQFESSFWGNTDFLQLRGNNTLYWQNGPHSNTTPKDMSLRTNGAHIEKYFHNLPTYNHPAPFIPFEYEFRSCKELFQVPFTIRQSDGTIAFRKAVFNPDIMMSGTHQVGAGYTTNQFQYILNWRGNQNWILDDNNNMLFSVYTLIPYTAKSIGIYRMIYQEPICFDNLNKRIVCRTVDSSAFDTTNSSQFISHYITAYQV